MDLSQLDLGYLAQFVGMRLNELVLDGLRTAGFAAIRESHGFVFQHLVDGPRTVTDLARRLGVTQQAASKSVAELVRLGFLRDAASDDKRARTVELSPHGAACLAKARALRAALMRRIAKRHGEAAERAHAVLADILEELGGAEAVRTRSVRAPR